ncbi:MAG: TetR/AcrR family transcriptional regulator [Ilumatobacteraceae bacterium]
MGVSVQKRSRDGAAPGKPQASKTPRRVSRESSLKTREMILDGALVEFAEKGFDGARIDEIALRAGVNKNLLYHHYGSKDGLFGALLERTYETIRRRQNDLHLRGLDPREGMRKLVIFTGRVWVQHPEFLRLLQSENLNGGRHVRASAKVQQIYNPLLETVSELIARGARTGEFRKGVDPIDLYISISALTAHYISNHHTFEAIFGQRLMTPARIKQRLEHAADMVEGYLLAKRVR